MKVRKSVQSDADTLHQLFIDAAEYKHSFADRSWRDGFSQKGVDWMINNGDTYVAFIDSVMVGTTAIEWSDDGWADDAKQNAGYVKRLAVAKDCHGQGVGTQILEWATKEVFSKGREYLRLDCAQANTSLCAYYESHGFVLVESKIFPDSNGPKSNLYQKILN